ncbi:MAG: DUF503 domain-containing protein [Desulfovibrio sp.]|nr:MAG: DUF503 domain-containing protein [Desulfovibrio sp.]
MVIGILRLELTLHGNASLKGKRNVSRSLKHKLRSKFNVSVAETEALDSHTRLVLAAVTVGADAKHVRGRLTKAMNMVEAAAPEEITDSDMEIVDAEVLYQ